MNCPVSAGIAAQAVAASEGALDITIEYVKEREAFGQKVGQFQNTRFKLADVKTQVAVNRAFYEQCANKYATDELTTEEAAMLKLASCEMQCDVADQCSAALWRLRLYHGISHFPLLCRCSYSDNLRWHLGNHARTGGSIHLGSRIKRQE